MIFWNIVLYTTVIVLILFFIIGIFFGLLKAYWNLKFKFLVGLSNKRFIKTLPTYSLESREYTNIWSEACETFDIKNEFGLKIETRGCDGFSSLSIFIDEIKVFDDRESWNHYLPHEMRKYIVGEIKKLKQAQKDYEQRDKNLSKKTFDEEKQHLINKFSK